MKKKVIYISIFALIFNICFTPVYADDVSFPQFGGGFNNAAENDQKAAAVISAMLAASGVAVDPSLIDSEIDKATPVAISLVNKLHDFDQTLYNKIIGPDTSFTYDDKGQAIIDFTPWGATDIASFDSFVQSIFGDGALSGDPVSVNVQTPYTITVNGSEVIPWISNRTGYGGNGTQSNANYNFDWVAARGSYIIPYDGAYRTWWNDSYNYNSNHTKSVSFVVAGNNGDFTYYTSLFKAVEVTDNAYGHRYVLQLDKGDHDNFFPVWWLNDDATVAGVPAFVPVIFSNGKLGFYVYSYVWSGAYRPWIFNNKNFVLLGCVYPSGYLSPKHNDSGSYTLHSDGIINIFSNDNRTIIVNGDNYNDIVNNYINNDLVGPNYTDPFTWDTGGGGNITQDGNGWHFSLDGFNLPDLNINWKLDIGLKSKFPFSIPWDVAAFIDVLDAEPEAPQFTGDIDLGVYIWHFDLDLEDWDPVAAIFRKFMLITVIFGLIVATRSIIRGL